MVEHPMLTHHARLVFDPQQDLHPITLVERHSPRSLNIPSLTRDRKCHPGPAGAVIPFLPVKHLTGV